jgi:cysteinyl-tRNA synthetase
LFSGSHPLLEKGFSPMTVRFFMLQSHYSSTLDFSNEALHAAEKGFKKLSNALTLAKNLTHPRVAEPHPETEQELQQLVDSLYKEMSDDFNTAKTLAVLFEMSSRINDFKSGNIPFANVSTSIFKQFIDAYIQFMEDVLGLKEEEIQNHELLNGVISVLIDLRKKARVDRNYQLSDRIRDDLKKVGVQLKDGKDGEITFSID